MPYFAYRQNNSGGVFIKPAIEVIVYAANAEEADFRAECHGVYFDGVRKGRDCSCCDDRWYAQLSGGSDSIPPESDYDVSCATKAKIPYRIFLNTPK